MTIYYGIAGIGKYVTFNDTKIIVLNFVKSSTLEVANRAPN